MHPFSAREIEANMLFSIKNCRQGNMISMGRGWCYIFNFVSQYQLERFLSLYSVEETEYQEWTKWMLIYIAVQCRAICQGNLPYYAFRITGHVATVEEIIAIHGLSTTLQWGDFTEAEFKTWQRDRDRAVEKRKEKFVPSTRELPTREDLYWSDSSQWNQTDRLVA